MVLSEASLRRLAIVAPGGDLPAAFGNVTRDAAQHLVRLLDVRDLRDRAFAEHGMTRVHLEQYASDDARGWHIVMTDSDGRAVSCVRCVEQANTVTVQTLHGYSPAWTPAMVAAVQSDLDEARRAGFWYGEWGSFVVDDSRRGSADALIVALVAYAFGRIRGGALGLTLANVKYGAASILRRIAADETVLPGYFDARYHADVELVRFDSRRPAAKYEPLVARLQDRLATVPVFAAA